MVPGKFIRYEIALRRIIRSEASHGDHPVMLSIDEYLRTSYHPDADYVDGEIEGRNVGEYSHNQIQGLIYFLFTLNQKSWRVDAVIEQRMRIASSLVRVCDVAVFELDKPHEEVTTLPPLICIEVLSQSDRLNRAMDVLTDYLSMGVPNIWVVDPLRRLAYTFDSTGLHPVLTSKLTVSNTPIVVDMGELFDELDKKIAAYKRL